MLAVTESKLQAHGEIYDDKTYLNTILYIVRDGSVNVTGDTSTFSRLETSWGQNLLYNI